MVSRAVEIVDNRLYSVGGVVELDGSVSWMPVDVSGFQPVHAYVMLDDNAAILVDTGVACHEELVIEQLQALLPRHHKVSLFMTRAEFDCVGNLGPIVSTFNVDTVYSGGANNPFDAFGYLGTLDQRRPSAVIGIERGGAAFTVPLSETRQLDVFTAPLRNLTTFWAYDSATKTLFTSDVFGYTSIPSAEGPRVVDSVGSREDVVAKLEPFLLAKHWWLMRADTSEIRRALAGVFERFQVDVIAPTYGCAIRGRSQVSVAFQALDDALAHHHVSRRQAV